MGQAEVGNVKVKKTTTVRRMTVDPAWALYACMIAVVHARVIFVPKNDAGAWQELLRQQQARQFNLICMYIYIYIPNTCITHGWMMKCMQVSENTVQFMAQAVAKQIH